MRQPKRYIEELLGIAGIVAVAAVFIMVISGLYPPLSRSTLENVVLSLFAVSGTMTALVLPAAGIIGPLIARRIDFSSDRVGDGNVTDKGKIAADLAILRRAKRRAEAAWRGSVYVFIALALSSSLFFLRDLDICSFTLHLDQLVMGLAFGFLLSGSFWFFLPSYWAYEFSNLKTQLQILESEVQEGDAALGQIPKPLSKKP